MARMNLEQYRVAFLMFARRGEVETAPVQEPSESQIFQWLNQALTTIQQRIPIAGLDDDEVRTWDRVAETLARIWRPPTSAATADIEFEATTVTISSEAPEDRPVVGDDIGFIPTTQSDLTTAENKALPLRWYTISAIEDGDAIDRSVLTVPALQETTNETAEFITAQVPELEAALEAAESDALRDMVPKLAAAYHAESQDRIGVAETLKAIVNRMIDEFSRDEDSTTLPKRLVVDRPFPLTRRL